MSTVGFGEVVAKDAFILRQHVGDAGSDDNKYELALVNGHTPSVKSIKTGKTFVLTWTDLIRMSIDAGVDE